MPFVRNRGQKNGEALTPYWQTTDRSAVRLYLGDVLAVLGRLPAGSVQTVVTSPPYWGLRDYGTGIWAGGDPACNHLAPVMQIHAISNHKEENKPREIWKACKKCGARRTDQQLGSEPSPDCGGWAGRLTAEAVYALVLPVVRDQGGRPEFAAKIIADLLAAAAVKREPCGRCFVCNMMAVFRQVRRVLRDDGTVWLNLGDTYGGGKVGRTDLARIGGSVGSAPKVVASERVAGQNFSGNGNTDLPSGNLIGVPWRVALALQADGWVLRQDIIWAKPAPMPESVTNRCTKAHEYVFLLAKRAGYYCDMDAVKEQSVRDPHPRKGLPKEGQTAGPMDRGGFSQYDKAEQGRVYGADGSPNKRSVWSVDDGAGLAAWLAGHCPETLAAYEAVAAGKTDVWRVSTQGYAGAHFATFPPKLIEPCILAGTSARGACPTCGAPWRRVTDRQPLVRERPNEYVKRTGAEGTGNSCANTVAGVDAKTLGWAPGCGCYGVPQVKEAPQKPSNFTKGASVFHGGTKGTAPGQVLHSDAREPTAGEEQTTTWEVAKAAWLLEWERLKPVYDALPVVPCLVLDPFIGSGTTAEVCIAHGRRCWGVDLSDTYLRANAVPRVEAALLGRRMGHLVPRPGGAGEVVRGGTVVRAGGKNF